MSPMHARSLQRLLERCTAAWEEQYGPIPEQALTFDGVKQ